MSIKVCPYPGLRPFTDEESFFFKGRDTHIRQIISKLETNKILVLTGASGDGKSSLVYAGVIPNARAGFFRAKYNKWRFVDFRPERSPLQNLAKSLASSLNLEYDFTLEELNYGFSALVDLYKSSGFYIDEESAEWQNADATEKRTRQLKASNLFILADQFEEFYTNAENFNNGKASANAYNTVNLLLETYKIALRENLPIYIICTLRSDFISQCIAFRGLPETIGFSQFFVPRLNRSELQQVIEEPATLSGGKISRRLKEVLINSLHEGFDQLPLLQHTLKQLWVCADNGNEDLDLIHLAKLGGLHPKSLTGEDQKVFAQWLETIPDHQKLHLQNPSANNVLNAHANYLFDASVSYFNEKVSWAERKIIAADAHLIIKTSFQCLTKADQGRAVRNRTTLEEISKIIDREDISVATICGVLNIFRLQDSTFIRPFIQENDLETSFLGFDTVLDITHEALIRNWEYLKQWNAEEAVNINTFREFSVQLDRWLENGKSKDFLLPIGPLLHFEEWNERCKPNKYWIARYDSSNKIYPEKVNAAEVQFENAEDFAKASRSFIEHHERLRKQRKNIALISISIITLLLSVLSYWAVRQKSFAENQTVFARQQTDSANFERNRALEATKFAGQQRLLAEQNAHSALLSKQQSDSARNLAEILRRLAENQSKLAQTEAENARREKKLADEQRKIADVQRSRAELASDSARALSYLAIAQSLGFKATQKFDDKEINLLLALQAYNFQEKYKGYNRDAIIYNGLRFSIANMGIKNSFAINNESVSSYLLNDNILQLLSKNGKLIAINLELGKRTSEKIIFENIVPVNSSFFLNSEWVLAGFEDKHVLLYHVPSGKKFTLPGHTDYIRATAMDKAKKILLTAGRDKNILVWNVSSSTVEVARQFAVDGRVSSVAISKDGTFAYAGTTAGSVIKISLTSGKQEVFAKNNHAVLSTIISPDGKYLATGLANGHVKLSEISNSVQIFDIAVGSSGVRRITFSDNSKIMATAGDDKAVKLFNLDNLRENPIQITDNQVKVVNFNFVGEKLFAQMNDNTFIFWESSADAYARQASENLSRNFSLEEWRIFIGDKITYQTTK
jgi:hypothetical protein